MEVFVWNMAISYQLLFVIVSCTIFVYIGEQSFKHYALYNIFLAIYVLSRNEVYYHVLLDYAGKFIGPENTHIFLFTFFFYVQVVFYTFYARFALYFLDLNLHAAKYFNRVNKSLKILAVIMFLGGIVGYYLNDSGVLASLFTFIYLPSLLYTFLATLLYAMRYSAGHRKFFLVGITFFVIFGLVAFIGSSVEALNMHNPINYFYIGVILETIFFSLGLAHKLKLLNEEKVRVKREVVKSKHRQQISKFHGLLEGEERERKRLAEELHDGIAGDLAAIKYNISTLKTDLKGSGKDVLIDDLTKIIDKSCLQIREISHNLSPSIVTNFGLTRALEEFCIQNQNMHDISIALRISGKPFKLSKLAETHLYRIIQELVANIVKHSGAKNAIIKIWHHAPYLTVVVSDDGTGFPEVENISGIGLSNINSRIRFLNATIKTESDETGSRFDIEIDLRKVPQA